VLVSVTGSFAEVQIPGVQGYASASTQHDSRCDTLPLQNFWLMIEHRFAENPRGFE